MFTGLIEDVGRVRAVSAGQDGAVLEVATALGVQLHPGDSVAVNGVCLTATDASADGFTAQAMNETLQRTSLGALAPGASVNLELPLRPTGRLGGHIVQGHVDGLGRVAAVRPDGFARVVAIAPPPSMLRYLVHKGSVAVDGVSLTVSRLSEDAFEVSLIPETLERTTLGALNENDEVNLEADVLAKHVERLLDFEGAAR